ncbi:glutamate 5-kinase [Phaffia rhodozyma]|uniref:Glutamate 5-kinase n=1 Tax=Phaffia rhodozyma TaxID=264483 RepID=A0A0F7SXF2_PHARH|nr:glutamate 5-kinase [Phaffia rhodozyma]
MRNPLHIGSSTSLTIVIKLGTSSIVDAETHQPLLSLLSSIVETICKLRALGHRVVLVSSGAIGVGLKRMGMKERGKSLSTKQALAAIGQGRLIALYDNLFSQLEQPIAQVLLTRGDISDRTRYLNAVNTFTELLSMGVVPIVNENDTVSVSEIRFGDNDTLSAIASNMVHADYLFLMTDVDCLYTDNPRKNPDAKPVRVVDDIESIRQKVSTATLGTSLGTGGMETKLIAAELAMGAGVTTVILNSQKISSIFPIIAAADTAVIDENTLPQHTRFLRKDQPLGDRKWWILHGLHTSGEIVIDEGAYRALTRKHSGGRLLAAGVVQVKGVFASQQAVKIVVRLSRSSLSSYHPEPDSNNNTQPSSRSHTPSSSHRNPLASGLTHGSDSISASTSNSTVNSPEVAPITPSLLPSMSLSSSIASLDPLSTSVSISPIPHSVSPSLASPALVPAVVAATSEEDEWEYVEVGKGQANYNSSEIDRIKGMKSSRISEILGYADTEHVVDSITLKISAIA